ncbi:MAG: transporter substrate-binding domain-containing protein, partial [Chitinivibrionales bacterium]|nr:transporter substrate-binding domain-containing protein [Chitinivibrionales bacterium]
MCLNSYKLFFTVLWWLRKRCSPHFSLRGCFFGIIIAALLFCWGKPEARTVLIGVYDNPPKVIIDNTGKPRGIFIDIFEYVAKRQGWDIHYIPGTWDEGLKRLDKDSIDLMPDVAFDDIRNKRFNFNQLAILSSWLQVFGRKEAAIESVSDLEGKTIAILEGSIQQQAWNEISVRFGIRFTQLLLPDYESIIQQIKSGKADAMIASRFYGYQRKRQDNAVPTAVILHPTTLHFAAPQGRNQDVLDAIDKHVAEMMNAPRSVYYQSLVTWLHEKPRMFVPRYVLWLIIVMIIAIIFFFIASLVLKWHVKKAT